MNLEFDPARFFAELDGKNREFGAFRRAYAEREQLYKKALSEIKKELEEIKRRLSREARLRIAYIDGRIKKVHSIIRKACDKGIPAQNVFDEIPDILGIRIVVNNLRDIEPLTAEMQAVPGLSLLESEEHSDEIGYRALHFKASYLIKGEGAKEPVIFEIQIRTVLQDAWAILTHRDVYKNKSDLPRLAASLSENMSRILSAFDRMADDFRRELEAIVEPPNDLSSDAPLDKEGISFLYYEQFGEKASEYEIQHLQKVTEEYKVETIGHARKGLNQKVFGQLRKTHKKYFRMDASNVDLFEYGIIYAMEGKRAYNRYRKKLADERAEIDSTARAEALSSMPKTFEEFLDLIEAEGIPWESIRELGGVGDCAMCGSEILDPEAAADGVLDYYDYPETDVDLEKIFRESGDIDAPEVGDFNHSGLCPGCGNMWSKND